ncbi:MAG: SHOCT domain-containing protein [Clostridia bacterium]|nr:SHOCT domain-containing protein [Clostridia bacterium]
MIDQTILTRSESLKFRRPIRVFAILALILHLIARVTYFIGYDWSSASKEYTTRFQFPDAYSIIFFLLFLIPYILLLVYPAVSCHGRKDKVFAAVLFGVCSFFELRSVITEIVDTITSAGKYLENSEIMREIILSSILPLTLFALLLVAMIGKIKGFSIKIPLIAYAVLSVTAFTISILTSFQYFKYYTEDGLLLQLVFSLVGRLGSILFSIAIFFIGLRETRRSSSVPVTPEEELKGLKELFDLGNITEEEYQAKRSEIINKL